MQSVFSDCNKSKSPHKVAARRSNLTRKSQQMSVDRILYDAMGVKVNASSYEIRQAYVAKSSRAEPGSQEFELIKAAYRVLMNPNLRRIYDESGLVGLNNLFPNQPKKPKIFELQECEGQESEGMKVFLFEISLKEAFFGGDFQVEFWWDVICSSCKGTGTRSGNRHPSCSLCRGSGYVVKDLGIPGLAPTKQICEACLGRGEMEVESDLCLSCYGRKIEKQKIKAKLVVPPGSQRGDVFSVNGMTDLKILLNIRMDDNISLSGADLVFRKQLTLTQSLLGFQFPVTTITGAVLVIESPSVPVPHGTMFHIKNHGYCAKGSIENRGDLIVVFSVVLPAPRNITPSLSDILRRMVPESDEIPKSPSLSIKFVQCQIRDPTAAELDDLNGLQ